MIPYLQGVATDNLSWQILTMQPATLKVFVFPPDLKPVTFRMLGKYINIYYGGTAHMH